MNARVKASSRWNEPRYQMLTRVIDAICYDLEPGMRTVLVSAYLARTAYAEVGALMRRRRKPHTGASARRGPAKIRSTL